MAWKGWLEFDAAGTAGRVNVPVQVVHTRTAAAPGGAGLYYSKLRAPRNIIRVEGAAQFDFYDGEGLTDRAVKESARRFGGHLS
jgi:fermentation-respiration switch protein FrsA (DUF1100 family)